jgi:hypothetical protein
VRVEGDTHATDAAVVHKALRILQKQARHLASQPLRPLRSNSPADSSSKAADSSSKAAESSSKGSPNVANAAHGEGVGGAGGGGGGREEAVTQLPTPTKHREGRPMKALFKALLRRL